MIKEEKNEDLLELILSALNELVDFELAVILKVQDRDTLAVKKAMGPLSTEALSGYIISLNERNDIAELMKGGEPYLFPEDEAHTDTYEEILDLPDGHSCLVSPLQLHDQPVGMLTLDHRACSMFSPAIVRFIGTISKLISIILVQSDSSAVLMEQKKKLTEERNLLLSTDSDIFNNAVGESAAWKTVLESAKLVAGSDVSVLIQGETGTGKEEIARLIHRLSLRGSKPFVAMNCSTLTPSLAESSLFGHEKGAFTDALSSRKGWFELADGGTLFLDEIGDLPLEIQPKLLRTLQEGVFRRIGGERDISCDVRIIAASHVELESAIDNKKFRSDLYYRIGVFPIHLPPLRSRGDDVLLLSEYFLHRIMQKSGKDIPGLSREAVLFMLDYSWPGNVRELYNILNRAVLLSRAVK